MAGFLKKIENANIYEIIDIDISFIEELKTGVKIHRGKHSGFSLTPNHVLLWYQMKGDVIRYGFWNKKQVKIAKT